MSLVGLLFVQKNVEERASLYQTVRITGLFSRVERMDWESLPCRPRDRSTPPMFLDTPPDLTVACLH